MPSTPVASTPNMRQNSSTRKQHSKPRRAPGERSGSSSAYLPCMIPWRAEPNMPSVRRPHYATITITITINSTVVACHQQHPCNDTAEVCRSTVGGRCVVVLRMSLGGRRGPLSASLAGSLYALRGTIVNGTKYCS